MRPRKQVDLTNVEVDFSSVKTRNAHTSLPLNSSDTHASVIASLLSSEAGNNNINNDEENKEPLIVQAFDPTMQSYLNRHAQQAKGRRRNLFASVQPSSASASSVPEIQKSNNNVNSKNNNNNNTNIKVKTNSNNHSSNIFDGAREQSTAADFIKEIDSVTNAVQEQQRLQAKYEEALQTFIHGASLIVDEKTKEEHEQQLEKEQSESLATQSHSAFPSCFVNTNHSMLSHLFADGVPDVEPWDRWALAIPRYGDEFIQERFHRKAQYTSTGKNNTNDTNTINKNSVNKVDGEFSVDYVITPVLPESHYTLHYQYASMHNMSRKDKLIDTMKTKSQLRAERRDRLRAKQQERKEAKLKMQAAITEHKEQSRQTAQTVVDSSNLEFVNPSSSSLLLSSSFSSPVPHDRLSTKNLTLNLFTHSVLNPLATEKAVLTQYEQRYLEHQRRNHERHVATIPAQIAKRARDLQLHSITNPSLRVYRVYPIYSPSHLAKIRHYANDNLLRGFVLWISQIDSLIVLCGGDVALRHLDSWIMTKMKWEHELTRARRVCTVPLLDAHAFSFHQKPAAVNLMSSKASQTKNISNSNSSNNNINNDDDNNNNNSSNQNNNNATSEREAVYMNFVNSIEEGVIFLQSLPANRTPWHDLSVLWRAAFMQSSTV